MTDESQRIRDPEGTREAILDAAEKLFADRGFAATSMRDISEVSGASHPLIHHHFGTKEQLYAAVKRRLMDGYARRFPRAARAGSSPVSVRGEMRRMMAFLGDNPTLLRLCLRTRLEGNNQLWPGEPDQLDNLSRRIASTQRRGLIRGDLDPTCLAIMVLGLVSFWIENRAYFEARFPGPIDDRFYLRQAIALVERGVASARESPGQ